MAFGLRVVGCYGFRSRFCTLVNSVSCYENAAGRGLKV